MLTPMFPPDQAGIALQPYGLSLELSKRGHQVIVVYFKSRDVAGREAADRAMEAEMGWRIVRFNRTSSRLKMARALFSVIRDCDVVHAHGYTVLTQLAFLGSRLRRKPMCVTLHGTDVSAHKPHSPDFEKYVLKNVEAVITVSDYLRELAISKGLVREDARVIYAGIDYPAFARAASSVPKEPVVLSVKGLWPIAGVPNLIAAFAELGQDFPTLRLHIVGDGPGRDEYQELVQSLGLRDRVSFLGWIPNHQLPKHYAKARLFVLPSLVEALGIPLIEAAAAGTPVVATDVGGPTELITKGRFGLLCKPGDPHDLAGKMRQLLGNPALYEQFRANGIEWAKTCDWERVAEEYCEVYASLLARRK